MQGEDCLVGLEATIRDVLRARMADFTSRGYEYFGTTMEGSVALGQFPTFHFTNRSVSRNIRISFRAARDGRNGGFVVFVEKPVNKQLNVADFLRARTRADLSSQFRYVESDDVHTFAEKFFDLLRELMATELRSVIEGREFEETPIDWMGYK